MKIHLTIIVAMLIATSVNARNLTSVGGFGASADSVSIDRPGSNFEKWARLLDLSSQQKVKVIKMQQDLKKRIDEIKDTCQDKKEQQNQTAEATDGYKVKLNALLTKDQREKMRWLAENPQILR